MITLLLLFLGLAVGSFVNALVWRLYKRRDWVRERSECTNCGHKLGVKDLIPVLSWISLKGRCRYCKKAISPQYPLVEALTGLLFMFSYVFWPLGFGPAGTAVFMLWLFMLTLLVALSVYDLRHMLLPDKLVKLAGLTTISYIVVQFTQQPPVGVLIASLAGLISFGGLFYILYQVSGGRWIGGGDVKLGFVLGAWLGSVILSMLSIFLASVAGSFAALVLALQGRATRKTRLPFGPLLIGGFILSFFFGERLIAAYLELFL
jgi:leader peptidase (prepilin peptidase) / N-methyltransferase